MAVVKCGHGSKILIAKVGGCVGKGRQMLSSCANPRKTQEDTDRGASCKPGKQPGWKLHHLAPAACTSQPASRTGSHDIWDSTRKHRARGAPRSVKACATVQIWASPKASRVHRKVTGSWGSSADCHQGLGPGSKVAATRGPDPEVLVSLPVPPFSLLPVRRGREQPCSQPGLSVLEPADHKIKR